MSSSYRSNRLGLSHCDPYAMRRGGCLEFYCNMLEWFSWDSSLVLTTNWFNRPEMTYNVLSLTLSNQPTSKGLVRGPVQPVVTVVNCLVKY